MSSITGTSVLKPGGGAAVGGKPTVSLTVVTPAGRFAVSAPALLVAASCAPDAATRQGAEVESLYDIFLVVAAVIFVVVAGLIGWSILRYRVKGPGTRELPPQVHTNVALEITWFAIPTAIVVVLFIMSVNVTGKVDDVPQETTENPVVVKVDGFQWGWRFDFGDGLVVNSLPDDPAAISLPVSTPITFMLESPDVIHSFYVPRFLIKRDAVPGRTNRIDVTIEEPGTYSGVCAEFCGLLHNEMNFTINAVTPEEFEEWLDETRAEGG
jgi:cytochrome c oxidase subunit 2